MVRIVYYASLGIHLTNHEPVDTDEILRLQGMSWFMRKLISVATITLYVKHYNDDEGTEHIDIDQIGTGGFKGNREERTLTWTERAVDDPVFGPVGEHATLSFRTCVANVCRAVLSKSASRVELGWKMLKMHGKRRAGFQTPLNMDSFRHMFRVIHQRAERSGSPT